MTLGFFFWLMVAFATAACIILLPAATQMVSAGLIQHQVKEAAKGVLFVLVAIVVLVILYLLAYDAITL